MTRHILLAILLFFPGLGYAETYVPLGAGGEAVQVEVIEADAHATTLALEVRGLFLDQVAYPDGTYTTVSLAEGRVAVPGKPEVPFVSRFVAIPRDAAPEIEVVSERSLTLDGIRVAPAQPKPKRCGGSGSAPRFVCDLAIYERPNPYPGPLATIEEVGTMRDVHYARIRLNPVQFEPAQNRIVVHTRMRVRIRHEGGRFLADRRLSPTFESLYRSTFLNYEAMRLRENPLPAVERILILAPEGFVTAVQPLVEWKRRMGFRVDVVPLAVAGATSAAIKQYLKAQYADPNTRPTYVILVGDVQKMPTNHGIGGCASDFIYTQLEGNDLQSDLFISRFSVKDESDLANQVAKVVWYESGIQADASWLGGAVCISSSEGEGTSNDDYRSNIICDLQKEYGYNPVNKLFDSNGGNTVAKISGAINEGRGWVTYLGHGSGTAWGSVHPEFDVGHVNQLSNAWRLPTVVDISCDNGAFDQYDSCFAEAWMRAGKAGEPTGAVGIYSASTSAYWDEPAEMAIGMTKAFTKTGVHRWGDVAAAGRAYLQQVWGSGDTVQETFEQYILFGDASLLLRSAAPLPLAVEGPGVLPVGESDATFTVTRTDGAKVVGALVHVFREPDVDAAGYTGALGQVQVAVAPESAGDLTVVVTAFDAVPWVGEVPVVVTGCGVLRVKPAVVRCDATLDVTLWDQDLNQDSGAVEQAQVQVRVGGGPSKALALVETSPDSGRFQAPLNPAAYGLAPADQAVLTVTYSDASCDGTPTTVESASTFDCRAPEVLDVQVSDLTASSVRIGWRTDEPAQSRLLLGTDAPAKPYPDPGFGVVHAVEISGLTPLTHYVFTIEATDAAGNTGALSGPSAFDTPACTPACAGKECGPDGCGGFCGECAPDQECNASGKCFGGPGCETSWSPGCDGCKCEACVCNMDSYCCWSAWDDFCVNECVNDCGGCGSGTCTPDCTGKECGSDGCGGSCGTCAAGLGCVNGTCECIPNCAGKECGPDGCGGTCGKCHFGQECVVGSCICMPSCDGLACGVDGCGHSCGTCAEGLVCHEGACVCAPACDGRDCGPDGCGGVCGECGAAETCNASGRCEPVCTPDCSNRECGPDGCGGTCGECADGTACVNGRCECVPRCEGRACGPDGCGGSCGSCAAGFACVDGSCRCEPACEGRRCGPDGCGGVCGVCEPGKVCTVDGQCIMRPVAEDVAVPDSGAPDASAEPDPSGVQAAGGGGCSVGSGAGGLWPLLWLGLLWVRRRR